jgi:thioredoxin 1
MGEGKDQELERIRQMKLQEMLKSSTSKEQKPTLTKPVEVSDATFEETVRKYRLVVIDCWAPWCGPCRMLAPIVEELAREYAQKIVFGKLNVDENPKTSMRYQTMSIPTLLVFKNGKLMDRIVGAMSRPALEAKITCYLK